MSENCSPQEVLDAIDDGRNKFKFFFMDGPYEIEFSIEDKADSSKWQAVFWMRGIGDPILSIFEVDIMTMLKCMLNVGEELVKKLDVYGWKNDDSEYLSKAIKSGKTQLSQKIQRSGGVVR